MPLPIHLCLTPKKPMNHRCQQHVPVFVAAIVLASLPKLVIPFVIGERAGPLWYNLPQLQCGTRTRLRAQDQQQGAGEPCRRTFLESMIIGGTTMSSTWLNPASVLAEEEESGSTPLFQNPSGLKYLDLAQGTGPTPNYGQLLSIAYTAYIKLPASKKDSNPKPERFDQCSEYLLKHGNGKLVPGLDEGLHTMRVGGVRRILIPPKLGYTRPGLGPLPVSPFDRDKLNRLLDRMVQVRGGTLVFEVKLLSVIDDEADQGYYQDGSLTDQQLEELESKIRGGLKKT